ASLGSSDGGASISASYGGEDPRDITWAVFRDGARIASGLSGEQTTWVDDATDGMTHCYSIETVYRGSGTASQHAEPTCDWGPNYAHIRSVPANNFAAEGGRFVDAYGRRFYEEWGDPGHQLEATFVADHSGPHLVQAVYGNGAGGIDTGITCAVKHVT